MNENEINIKTNKKFENKVYSESYIPLYDNKDIEH